jgi:hypothetical protein
LRPPTKFPGYQDNVGANAREPHRERYVWHPPGCSARKLSKKEMASCPRARKALDAEWEKLRFLKRPDPGKGVGAWDEGNVREASSVREEARLAGKTVHFGRPVELCHEKGSELDVGDPEKMKGRSVLLGDNIKDQDFSWAEICELGSSPTSIEAAKAPDAMGSLPGCKVKTGDANWGIHPSTLARRRDLGQPTRKPTAETLGRQTPQACR